jgi:uncharacterized protein
MKNALILHGTNAKSTDNWFPWLKAELENIGYNVWVPDLPQADKPSIRRYNEFLLSKEFDFNEETIIIGHSAGAVAILGLLHELPNTVSINKAILVGAFRNDLGWESLNELFVPLDFKKIKQKAKQITLIHSDNDPYIPLEQPEYLAKELDTDLIVLTGQKHFSIGDDPKFERLPYILEVLNDDQ